MIKKILPAIIVLFLISMPSFAQSYTKYAGWIEQGGGTVTTSGLTSSTFVQRSFKTGTITVTDAGTGMAVSIYSTSSGTALANPFTNQNTATGQFFFYVANGRYNIQIAATGLTTYTLGDISIFSLPSTTGTVSGTGTINVGVKWTTTGSTIGNSTYFDDGTSASIGTLAATDDPTHTRFEVQKDQDAITQIEVRNATTTANAQAAVLIQSGASTNNLTLGVTAVAGSGTGVVTSGAGYLYTGANTNGMWYATHNGNHTFAIGGLEGMRLNTSWELCIAVQANPCNARLDVRGNTSGIQNLTAIDAHVGAADRSVFRLFNDTLSNSSPAWEMLVANDGRLDLTGNADAKLNVITHNVVRMSISHTGETIFTRNTGGTVPAPTAGTTLTVTGNTSTALPSAATFASPPIVHIVNADATAAPVIIDSFATNGLLVFRRADGTLDAPTALQNNEDMGHVGWHGYGTGYTTVRASLEVHAAENWTNTANGTRFALWTTANLTTTPISRMTISNAGETLFTNNCTGTFGNCMIPNTGVPVTVTQSTSTVAPSVAGVGTPPVEQVVGADGVLNLVLLNAFANQSEVRLRRADGTLNAPTTLQTNDVIGQLSADGYNSASYGGVTARGAVRFYATENWGSPTGQGLAVDIQTTTAGSATITTKVTFKDGMYVGAATGGDKGVGTINVASGVYLNGTAYTNPDFGLEHWATGHVVQFASNPGAKNYHGLMPLSDVETFSRQNLYLPQLDVFHAHNQSTDIFQRADVNLLLHEETFIHLFEHEHRITYLEASVQALESRIQALEAK